LPLLLDQLDDRLEAFIGGRLCQDTQGTVLDCRLQVAISFIGGTHDHRGVDETGIILKMRDGLQTIHAVHQKVDEDRVRVKIFQLFDGLFSRLRHFYLIETVLFQQTAQHDPRRFGIIDKKGLFSHVPFSNQVDCYRASGRPIRENRHIVI